MINYILTENYFIHQNPWNVTIFDPDLTELRIYPQMRQNSQPETGLVERLDIPGEIKRARTALTRTTQEDKLMIFIHGT